MTMNNLTGKISQTQLITLADRFRHSAFQRQQCVTLVDDDTSGEIRLSYVILVPFSTLMDLAKFVEQVVVTCLLISHVV